MRPNLGDQLYITLYLPAGMAVYWIMKKRLDQESNQKEHGDQESGREKHGEWESGREKHTDAEGKSWRIP